jgi:methionyl-tRNA formyltransferase
MKIFFMGATELGLKCCQELIALNQEIVGIFTIPKSFSISVSVNQVNNVKFANFTNFAEFNKIPFKLITKKISDTEYSQFVKEKNPDLIVVIGWYYLVPKSIREIPKFGAIGIHGSLLPKYKGWSPLVWAIINGEKKTGASLFYLESGVDDGDIIGQETFEISEDEYIGESLEKLEKASLSLIRKYIPLMEKGCSPRITQALEESTHFNIRNPEDGIINWENQSSTEIFNWIRAQSKPYPGAFTYLAGKKITIWKAHIERSEDRYQPGDLVKLSKNSIFEIGFYCKDNRVLVVDEASIDNGFDVFQRPEIYTKIFNS